jgi:hypothetical protein
MSSNSERTFGNKLEHCRDLHVALSKIAGYKPDNALLELDALANYFDTVEEGNNTVASKGQPLSDRRNARRLGYFGDIKGNVGGLVTLAGRVRDYVGAMPGGKKSPSYKQIQRLVQKISNYRPPKKPVTGTPDANKKEISQSEASYGSLVQAGRDLAAAAAAVPGYNPSAADLQPAALKAFMQTLADHNRLVAEARIDAANAIAARALLYDDEKTGLQARFHQAKAAVASQFGRRSPEYKSIAHIKY